MAKNEENTSSSTSRRRRRADMAPKPPVNPPRSQDDLAVAVAASAEEGGGTVTARKAGGLRDVGMNVNPRRVGIPAALQHLAKGVNVAFQSDYGENYLEAVYQAAIVDGDEILIVHKEYFGFGDSWFSQFGKLFRSLQLTLDGPDPASPEGQRRLQEHGPATIRGILNLFGRKLDLVAEYEDRVPAYVEQMFDRLEASGIIEGWNRNDWTIRTTRIGLDIRIRPTDALMAELEARNEKAGPSKPSSGSGRAESKSKSNSNSNSKSKSQSRKSTSASKKSGGRSSKSRSRSED